MNTVASAKAGVGREAAAGRAATGARPERPDVAIAYPNDTIADGAWICRLTDDQELLRRSIREFAETRDPSPRHGVGRSAALSDGAHPEACRARADGHPVSGGVRRRRRCRRSTTASASRSWRASIRRCACPWRRTTALAPRTSSTFGTEEQKQQYLMPLAQGEQLAAWGLTEASSGSDAGGDADDGHARRRLLGHQRHQAVHHPRPARRPDRGDGGHQPRQGQPRHLGLHRRARDARVPRRQEGRQARDARQRDERGHLRELPGPGVAAARARRPGLHQRAAGARRRAHRHRRAGGRPRAGRLRSGARATRSSGSSSASRSARSRHPREARETRRRGSRRRGC